MATQNASTPNMSQQRNLAKANRGKILAVFIFLFIIIFHFVYGFESKFYQYSNASEAIYSIPLLLMSTLFTLVGFGLLLSAYSKTKLSGLGITLFILSFNYLLGPLFHQLWFNAFISWLTGDVNLIAPNASEYWLRGSQSAVTPSDLTFRLSNLCSVSFLIGVTGMIGRISLSGIFIMQILFNFLWYLNLNLNVLMSQQRNPKSLVYFDDYGTYIVYLFGAVVGIVVCLLNATPRQYMKRDKTATIFTVLGATFLFCSFAFTNLDIIKLTGTAAHYKANAQAANIWFSIIGSTLGVYSGAVIINKGKVGVSQITFGIVTGGVMIGAGAGYIENIGACTFLGFVAGFITAIVMNTVVPRMNSSNIVDSQGFIIPILIVTFLGGFFAFPCILLRHFSLGNDEGTTYGALGGVKQTQWQVAGFQLGYFGVTLFMAFITGGIAGITLKGTREEYSDYSDFKIFSEDFGLYDEDEPEVKEKERMSEEKIQQPQSMEKVREQNRSEKQLKDDVI